MPWSVAGLKGSDSTAPDKETGRTTHGLFLDAQRNDGCRLGIPSQANRVILMMCDASWLYRSAAGGLIFFAGK